MRLTTVLLIASLMQVSAASFAQKITLSKTNAPLKTVLKELRLQSGFDFIATEALLEKSKSVSLKVKDMELENVLENIFDEQPLTYTIENKTVTLKAKEPSFLDKVVGKVNSYLANIDARGRILDESGKPLEGATVVLKGTSRTAKTDVKGEFVLANVPDDGVLVIRYVGYKQLEVGLKDAVMPLVIKLNVATGELEEVNVTYSTGYQNIPKERSTGSFEFVDNKLLNRRMSSNVLDRLQGIVSTMAFNRDDRLGSTEISVRGRSTIFSNVNPLIILDNYPYEGDINNINPNDIESITVLKDAAAASVWGTRAGNGVIVINTKSGKLNQQLSINLSSNVTLAEKPDLFYTSKLNPSDAIDIETFLFNKGFYNTAINNTTTFPALSPVVEILAKARSGQLNQGEANRQIDILRAVDNRNEYARYSYKNQTTHRHSLNISGGSPKIGYYFSSGYDNDISSFKAVSDRVTANLKTTFHLTSKLDIRAAGFFARNSDKEGTLPLASTSRYLYESVVDVNGNGLRATRDFRRDFEDQVVGRGFLDWTYNPFEDAKLSNELSKRDDIRFNIAASYKLFDFLSLELNYQFHIQDIARNTIFSQNKFATRDLINRYSQIDAVTKNVIERPIPTGGMFNNFENQLTENNGRAQLNFDKRWGKNQVNAISGFEVSEAVGSSSTFRLYGYDEGTTLSKTVNYATRYTTYPSRSTQSIPGAPAITAGSLNRFRSFYFNAAYSYMERYHFTVSARKDASNYFGVKSNQRSVPLWSAGIKYDLDKELFYNIAWLPSMKFRATYGYTGNINKNVNALTTIQYNGFSSIYNLERASILNPPNTSLKWETTSILNLGLDFGFKDNIISGSIEYYTKNGKDLIGDGPLDGTSGVTNTTGESRFRGNIADMNGRGMDITINTINIDGKFKWATNFLFSYNIDKITKYNLKPTVSSALSAIDISPIVGQPVNSLRAYRWGGLDPNTGDPLGYVNNQISKDYALIVNPQIEDLVYLGPTRAPYFGSFRNTFSFKGFTVSANIIYKFGHVLRNQTYTYNLLFSSPSMNGHAYFYDRWQKPGDERTTSIPSLIYPNNINRDNLYSLSEAVVVKGDHLRLQDIGFGYDFNNLKSLRLFRSLSVNAYVNNVGVLWKRSKELKDPDFITTYPVPRTYSIGINAQF